MCNYGGSTKLKTMHRAVLFLAGLFVMSSAIAQTKKVKGHLTFFNHYPAANVTVVAKHAKSTAVTDNQGDFELECEEKEIIQVKGKAFQAVNIRIGRNDDAIAANLIFKDSPKNRELAVGLGYLTEADLTYALANLQDENNDFCNYPDVFTLIKVKFSDVDVKTSSTGEPGVYLRRGQKSMFGETKALYVLDGTRVNDISFINPCEITKISIVKDAAAAIHGAGSANGVVVITTRGSR